MAKIRRAILSVTDKTGITELGAALDERNIELLSTGGTAKALRDKNVRVTEVSDYTGFPECFDGRVKTLHPKIHGGILFKRDDPKHVEEAQRLGIPPIDMVVVNLYEFEKTAREEGATLEKLVENVDIGGPAMLRSAFKNYKDVAVVTEPAMYQAIVDELKANGELSADTHRRLAVFAINRVADYDDAIAVELTKRLVGEETIRLVGRAGQQLGRYGENWHQKAWIFTIPGVKETNVVAAKQVHGPALGFNNYVDADAALQTVMEYDEPCAVVVKHCNPCGIATAETLEVALERAWQGDPVSAFGSILAFNREVDLDTVKVLGERKNGENKTGWMVEVIVAPSYSEEALDYIKSKDTKKSLRLLAVGDLKEAKGAFDYRMVRGGILRQSRDDSLYLGKSIDDLFEGAYLRTCKNSEKELLVGTVTRERPDPALKGLYEFAWKAVKHVKSNAIVIAREYAPGKYQVLGMGAGQPKRVQSAEIAVSIAEANLEREYKMLTDEESFDKYPILASEIQNMRSTISHTTLEDYKKHELAKCVAASDAFFPFTDGPEALAGFGIRNFIQPGGGNKDEEVTKLLNKYNAAMILTGRRHFLH